MVPVPHRRLARAASLLAVTACALIGCPREPDPPTPDAAVPTAPDATIEPAARPTGARPGDWIAAGSHEANGVVYGVGKANGIKNVSLARSTAAHRARAEIARQLGETTLVGVEIIEYSRTASGTTYALARYKIPRE